MNIWILNKIAKLINKTINFFLPQEEKYRDQDFVKAPFGIYPNFEIDHNLTVENLLELEDVEFDAVLDACKEIMQVRKKKKKEEYTQQLEEGKTLIKGDFAEFLENDDEIEYLEFPVRSDDWRIYVSKVELNPINIRFPAKSTFCKYSFTGDDAYLIVLNAYARYTNNPESFYLEEELANQEKISAKEFIASLLFRFGIHSKEELRRNAGPAINYRVEQRLLKEQEFQKEEEKSIKIEPIIKIEPKKLTEKEIQELKEEEFTVKYINEESVFPDSEEEEEELDLGFKGTALEAFGVDITKLAKEGKIDECFGRESELLEMMEILVRRQKNNPVLVGDAGVGKTAIIELFATRIVNNSVPFVLEGRRIVSVDISKIIAGARYRGEFELRLQKVLEEVIKEPNVIVFIDEIHNISGAGSAEGSLDAANMLKPVLSRSGFQCIGATTHKEYEKIEKDPALNRRFQPIRVNEPSVGDTVKILNNLRSTFEIFHNVEILPEALQAAAELSSRYIYDRFLPDKAIDLVDRAAAKEVIRATSVQQESVITAIINKGLKRLGNLRLEAFRKGDIGAEFVFHEVETAYRSFLLRWLQTPVSIPSTYIEALESMESSAEKKPASAISQYLFDKMQLSVLGNIENLLFASPKGKRKNKMSKRYPNFSPFKNDEILKTSLQNLDVNGDFSIYRISLLLLKLASDCNQSINKRQYKLIKVKEYRKKGIAKHIFDFVAQKQPYDKNFLQRDYEDYEYSLESLSEIDEARIGSLKNFVEELKPILRRGSVETLCSTAPIEFSDDELSSLYGLLGHFSTDIGQNFLLSLDEPEILKMARNNGNFASLKRKIGEAEIRNVISSMTGIPLQTLSLQEAEKLANLESTLHKRVIGQEEAVNAIARAIRRSRLGIQNPNRPIASLFFCGPTGVGKTEVTKALAEHMFGSEQSMIRFDMSEFMEKFSISRLIGSPPGYVGYEEGGQLTDGVRKKPYSVVLFDEIEKAHPDILNILLQILEDGRLTDSQKRLVLFDNTVIIMTSNAAAEEIQQIIRKQREEELQQNQLNQKENSNDEEEDVFALKKNLIYNDRYAGPIQFFDTPIQETYSSDLNGKIFASFGNSFKTYRDRIAEERKKYGYNNLLIPNQLLDQNAGNLKSAVLDRLTTIFLPEFLNRLDDIIIFQPLKPEELRKICDIMINQVIERVSKKSITLTVDEKVKEKLTRDGYNPMFGARPLRRLIIKNVEDSISDLVLKSKSVSSSKTITIFLNENDEISAKEILF